MDCESSGRASVVATEVIGGVTYRFVGLWQILDGSADPWENTRQAHAQYVGWQQGKRANPWPNCPRN